MESQKKNKAAFFSYSGLKLMIHVRAVLRKDYGETDGMFLEIWSSIGGRLSGKNTAEGLPPAIAALGDVVWYSDCSGSCDYCQARKTVQQEGYLKVGRLAHI